MPVFNFSPISKPITKRSSSSGSYVKYEIVKANVEGVVFITIDAKYAVGIEQSNYPIIPENFTCKGAADIYSQYLEPTRGNLNRLRITRPDGSRCERNTNIYLPFTAGCCVKGNIVKHKATKQLYFKIKKVTFDSDNSMARIAIKFYRANYHEILSARISRLSDEDILNMEKVFSDNGIIVETYRKAETNE